MVSGNRTYEVDVGNTLNLPGTSNVGIPGVYIIRVDQDFIEPTSEFMEMDNLQSPVVTCRSP